MKKVAALVLAGGAFSSLGILAERRAKAAIPFGGMYRIIDFVLSNLMNSDIEHVGILAQYRPSSLIDHIGGGTSWDLFGRTRALKILPPYQGKEDSDWYQGTADAVYQNLNFIYTHQPDEVLVLAGENIYSMNYQHLLRYHREKQADCTLVCNPLPAPNPHRFGIMSLTDDCRVTSYEEKPATIRGEYYSAGIYVFNTKFLLNKLTGDVAQKKSRHSFAKDILPNMLKAQERFYGYVFDKYWAYCGTVEEYWQANMDLLKESPELDLWHWNIRTNIDVRNIGGHQPAVLAPVANVTQSIISSGCKVHGTVENSVLSPGVIVEEGAIVRNSIIFHESIIKKDAVLDRVISDKDVVIGETTHMGVGDESIANEEIPKDECSGITVIGKEVQIGAHVQIGKNTLLYPGVSVQDHTEIASGRVVR